MSLPRIKINYLNGQLGTVGESPDGLFAIVCGAEAVGESFALEKAYTVRSLTELIALGLTEDTGGRLYKLVSDFYEEAEDGTELVVMGVGKTATMTSLLDKTTGKVRELISGQNGKLRGVFVACDGLTTGTAKEGLDPDVFTALPKAQALAEWATTELYAPLFVILEGRGYTGGTSLKDLSGESYDRVA